MANYIEAPLELEYDGLNLFLAGGITNCFDWQDLVAYRLKGIPLLDIYNPRRKVYNPADTEEQIKWEYRKLELADLIVFWFSFETVQPITLLEFGRWTWAHSLYLAEGAYGPKKIFVGAHPDYSRREDIEIQLKLVLPQQKLHNNLVDLCQEVKQYLSEGTELVQ